MAMGTTTPVRAPNRPPRPKAIKSEVSATQVKTSQAITDPATR